VKLTLELTPEALYRIVWIVLLLKVVVHLIH